ncbi:MAG: hypothetical protein CMD35_06805 [Flavobacteriales bacterium]|nr:hypothetical protein [Flavobacteriales bacterium]
MYLRVKILLLMTIWAPKIFGQFIALDTMRQYDFIRYDLNKISVKDSCTLSRFFEKVYTFESRDSGKVRVMHIGDSHIQAGYFTEKVRECIHKGLGCGTKERGFVFPFGMAHTNGPSNYAAQFTGNWKGFKSSSRTTSSNWGLAGISASTRDDSTTLKVYSNNHTFDSYRFNKVRIYFKDDLGAFSVSLRTDQSDSVFGHKDAYGCYKTFQIPDLNDTLYFTFKKNSENKEASFLIQGLELLNDEPGVTYSEVGVNGAEVKSFLRCQEFASQLAIVKPDLIVISLGTNDAYRLDFNDSLFYQNYDSLITVVRTALPNSNIILTTPGDGKRYRKTPLTENILIRKRILNLAKKKNCGVWDFYNVMGGLGSINHWYASELTAEDFLHLNEAGYAMQGRLFYNALSNSYNNYTAERRVRPLILKEGIDYDELLNGIFKYSSDQPIFFSHYLFWVFFTVFFLIYSFIYKNLKIRSLYLFLISLFFYYKAGGFYFSLLILSTLLDYFIGNRIYQSKRLIYKKTWLVTAVSLNLFLLFFFKYTGFFTEILNDLFDTHFQPYNVFAGLGNLFSEGKFDISEIILPVGISFYTFQTISYSVDVYRKKLEPVKNILDFGFYVSFFPQLVAGPIVRANEFIPQIYKSYRLTYDQFSKASLLILGGLVKKIIISDYISINFVDRVFESPLKYSGFDNLMGAYGYTIQIYCDFSAYSDIAIGLALLLGFTLPKNFNQPYLSTNITDFWRRWHISLSSWLRDYLYIPLGGNRKGKIRTYINLALTMLLGGLWHGASLKFIVWGGLHGGALAVHKIIRERKSIKTSSKFKSFLGWLLTFHFVVFCWVFFRAPDHETIGQMFNQIFFEFNISHVLEYFSNSSSRIIFTMMLCGYLMHLIPDSFELKIQKYFSNKWWPSIGIVAVVTVLLAYQFKTADIQPFIYFQF